MHIRLRRDHHDDPAGRRTGKASAPGRSGYWMTTADGEVHAFGDAKHHGQPRGMVETMVFRSEGLELTP